VTTSDKDAAAEAKDRFENALDALQNTPTNSNDDRTHSDNHVADHVSVEIDEAKQHAVSAIDTTLQTAVTAAKGVRTTYRRNPKKTLAMVGAVAVGFLALVTLLRRL